MEFESTFSVKDLKWMPDIQVPALSAARLMSEVKDYEHFGEALRMAFECIFLKKANPDIEIEWAAVLSGFLSAGMSDDAALCALDIVDKNGIFTFEFFKFKIVYLSTITLTVQLRYIKKNSAKPFRERRSLYLYMVWEN